MSEFDESDRELPDEEHQDVELGSTITHAVNSRLPALWGSPKQITWATTIRAERLRAWSSTIVKGTYARYCSVRDSSWWIANRDAHRPKDPTDAQCVDRTTARPAPREYRLDDAKTYHPRVVVEAPSREEMEQATSEPPPQRYGPRREAAAGNLVEFVNEMIQENLLAKAAMLAISTKLGDPVIRQAALYELKRCEDAVAAIKGILDGQVNCMRRNRRDPVDGELPPELADP